MLMRIFIPWLVLAALLGAAVGGTVVDWSFQPSAQPYETQKTTKSAPHHPSGETNEIVETERPDDKIARYTLWLAGLTGVLSVATLGGLAISGHQTNLSRQEFLATHRPELLMRDVTWEMVDMDGGEVVDDNAITF